MMHDEQGICSWSQRILVHDLMAEQQYHLYKPNGHIKAARHLELQQPVALVFLGIPWLLLTSSSFQSIDSFRFYKETMNAD
jgi:hypothetical protein